MKLVKSNYMRRAIAMAYTYEELKKKKVAELREIAAGMDHEALQGYTQLNKEHLLEAMCNALHIDMHKHHEIVGLDKTSIKKKIRDLKKKRDHAIEEHDYANLKDYRQQIKKLKNDLRRATV